MAEQIAAAWEAVILAEAAVSYAYAVAGPRLDPAGRTLAAQGYDDHERARDTALLALTATGAPAVGVPSFFELPDQVATPEQARALLATVESRLAVSYADLVAALPMDQRQRGIDAMLQATAQALAWGAAPGAWGAAEPGA